MSRTSDPKTLADAYTALHQGTLTVEQRSATRTIARILKAAGTTVPTVSANAAKTTAKASATPRKTNDPEAPYGRKADGTPRAKPGRKAAAPVVVAPPAKRVRKQKVTPASEVPTEQPKRTRTRKTSETGIQVVA